MALIDLKTELKSLKFGNDRPGGGSSNQPYQKFPIPEEGASKTALDFYELNRTGLDYPIRGGTSIVNPRVGSISTLAGQIDKDRISKFFQDKPRGTAFLELQKGLQLSNPKTQTGIAIGAVTGINNLLSGTTDLGLENTRVYNNGRNTLAQVLSSGTGVHLPRQGMIPIDTLEKYYLKTVGKEMLMSVEEVKNSNRLLILQKLKLQTNDGPIASINAVNSMGISINPNLLFQYLGGPGSTYGIGSTTIKRVQKTSDARELIKDRPDLFPNVFTMTYDQIANPYSTLSGSGQEIGSSLAKTNGVKKANRNTTRLSDFRRVTAFNTTAHPWVKEEGVDYRFYDNGVDKLNQKINFSSTDEDPFTNIKKDSSDDDIIKFGFECMSNDDPGQSTPLLFRAFLTKGISDTNTGEWSGFKYMGRGEQFYTYQGFQRSIGFGFKIVAFSADEMLPLYRKLNYLVSQVYPDYSDKGYMRAPLVKVTIGDYLYRVPGFLENVNLTIDNNAPWELNLDNAIYQLPKVIDVDISFKPIMNDLPRRSVSDREGKMTKQSVIIGTNAVNGILTFNQTAGSIGEDTNFTG